MSSKSKQQTTTTTQGAQPWVEEQLKFGNEQARALYDKGAPDYYSGQTFANFDPLTTQAQDLTVNRALSGNQGVRNAQGMIANTISGQFLNGNPNLSAAMDVANQGTIRQFTNSVMPQITGSFGRSGRYGSGAYNSAQSNAQQNLLTQIGNNNTNMSYANYNDERGRMMTAAGMSPVLAAQDYVDIAQLGSVGSMREGKAQEAINADMARYDYNANKAGVNLDQFLTRIGQISPLAGGVGTSTVPVAKANPWSQIAGLAGTAAGFAVGGPAGAAAGGSLGSALGGAAGGPAPTSYNGATTAGGFSTFGNGQRVNWY